MASFSRGTAPRRNTFVFAGAVLVVVVVVWLASSLFSYVAHSVEDTGVEDIALDDRGVDAVVYDAVYPGDELLELVETSLPAFRYTDHIEAVYQYPSYPSGCEIAALTCVLNSMGYDVTLAQMIEGDYVSYDSSWMGAASESYFGTPYGQGGAFPPAIVNAANRYLDEQAAQVQAEERLAIQGDAQAQSDVQAYVEGEERSEGQSEPSVQGGAQGAQGTQVQSEVRAEELDAASSEELISLVQMGYPVMVWATISYDAPAFSGEYIDGYAWYTNEHCVVLYGYDESADEVQISDSVSGYVSMSAQDFFELYEACGALSVVIR